MRARGRLGAMLCEALGHSETIEANVDAREIADRIEKIVFDHSGDIWFQEPAYNFAFFAPGLHRRGCDGRSLRFTVVLRRLGFDY